MGPGVVRGPAPVRTALRMLGAMLLAGLAACGHAPTRPAPVAQVAAPATAPARAGAGIDPCAPTRVHRDSDYTPGGLYLPGVADGGPTGPIDVDRLVEPTPRREPRARTGNRSPYSVLGKQYRVLDDPRGFRERGIASWYGTKFNGRATSSGELYDICSFTAAHKTLPLPSYVRVTNLDNGRSLVVRVNDRGPFHEGRVMDLSYAAAVRLGVSRTGTARVELEALDPDAPVDTRFAQAAPVPPPPSPPRRAPMPRAVAPMASGPSAASIVAGGNTLAALDDDDAAAPVELLPPSPDDRASTAPARAAAAPIAVVPAVAPPMLAMSAVPAPTPAPPAPTPAPAGEGARVQVGAFGDEANARRLVDRLAGAGLAEAAVDTLAAGERTLWRVSLGAIDAEAAAALVERLRAMGLPGARVLRR